MRRTLRLFWWTLCDLLSGRLVSRGMPPTRAGAVAVVALVLVIEVAIALLIAHAGGPMTDSGMP